MKTRTVNSALFLNRQGNVLIPTSDDLSQAHLLGNVKVLADHNLREHMNDFKSSGSHVTLDTSDELHDPEITKRIFNYADAYFPSGDMWIVGGFDLHVMLSEYVNGKINVIYIDRPNVTDRRVFNLLYYGIESNYSHLENKTAVLIDHVEELDVIKELQAVIKLKDMDALVEFTEGLKGVERLP